MPELPEVETIKNSLKGRILGKKIIKLEIRDVKIACNKASRIKRTLTGDFFVKIERIGKLLIFFLAQKNNFLLVHLKMTGQLIYLDKKETIAGGHEATDKEIGKLPNKHTRAVIYFIDGSKLFFNDLRRFGFLKIVDSEQLEIIKKNYGVEPLTTDFSVKKLSNIFRKKSANIKSILLNQKVISGIGNIYADEILFAAKINPTRQGNSLSLKEIKRIEIVANNVIKKAIKYQGTTFNSYVDSRRKKGNFSQFLMVYGRAEKKCLKCRIGIVKKIKLNGRGTHFCPVCQANSPN